MSGAVCGLKAICKYVDHAGSCDLWPICKFAQPGADEPVLDRSQGPVVLLNHDAAKQIGVVVTGKGKASREPKTAPTQKGGA